MASPGQINGIFTLLKCLQGSGGFFLDISVAPYAPGIQQMLLQWGRDGGDGVVGKDDLKCKTPKVDIWPDFDGLSKTGLDRLF